MSVQELYDRVENALPSFHGWCSKEKARKLVDIILREKPETCVEIGVFGGSSLFPQAMAVQYLGRGKVVGIDPWSVSAALEEMKEETNIQWWTSNVDYENLYQQCVQDLTALDLAGCCELVRAKAEDVVDRFGAESIGLLHIDGNHSQALSMKDATLYLPKVAPGGHIVFDDVSWMEKSMMTTQPALAYLLKHGCSEVDRTGDCAILRKRECIP